MLVRLLHSVRGSRLRELSTRRLRDRPERSRIRRYWDLLSAGRSENAESELVSLDHACRSAEGDRVHGDARLLCQGRALERLQHAARLGTVGEEEDRYGTLAVSAVAGLRERPHSVGKRPGRLALRRWLLSDDLPP